MRAFQKRKKVNINLKRDLQVWLLIRILGIVILTSVLAALILYFFARHQTLSSFYDAHIKIHRVSDLLLPVLGAGAFVSLISGAFLAFLIPLKIAGPISRIQRELEKVRNGDLTITIQLRKKDVLKDFANTVSDTISSLRANVQQIKESHAKFEKSITAECKSEVFESLNQQKTSLNRLKT